MSLVSLINFDDLLPEAVMYLPDCPEQVIKRWLRRAARDFCVDTEAWDYTFPVIDVTAFQPTYSLNAGENARVQRITSVRIDGSPQDADKIAYRDGDETLVFRDKYVPVTTTATIAAYDPTATYSANDEVKYDGQYYKARAAISVAESWTRYHWQEITDGMYVKVKLVPRLTATTIPEWMGDRWGIAIAAGAASLLLRMPKMPWTDLQMAAEREAKYKEGVRAGRMENYLGKLAQTRVFTSNPDRETERG